MSPKKRSETYLGLNIEEITWWSFGHPFEYAHTLMKMGYEPIPPSPENFFGTTYLALPNVFRYVRHISSVDGFSGCFRGLTPMLCQRIVNISVQRQIEDYYPWEPEFEGKIKPQPFFAKTLTLNDKGPPVLKDLARETSWKMISVSIGTVASHPFYVITIRMMAQFVGRETKYNSVLGSLRSIFKDDGIQGLFKGLVPRLISENLKIIVPACIFFILSKTFGNRHIVNSTVSVSKFFTERSAYKFDVVATTMIINNSTLVIGQAPFITKKFSGWVQCLSHLSKLNIHNRGRSWFFRYYSGPTVSINGEVRSAGVYFGPFHPRSTSGSKTIPAVQNLTKEAILSKPQ